MNKAQMPSNRYRNFSLTIKQNNFLKNEERILSDILFDKILCLDAIYILISYDHKYNENTYTKIFIHFKNPRYLTSMIKKFEGGTIEKYCKFKDYYKFIQDLKKNHYDELGIIPHQGKANNFNK